MAYSVHFTDRTFIKVEDAQADLIKQAQKAVNKPEYIGVGKNQYKLASISKIEWIKEPLQADRQIEQGHRCHGEKSIHLVIYEAYKKRLREGKHLDWETFRQKTYDYIYEQKPDVVWCDNKKGTCVCEQTRAVERVKEVMGEVQVIS